jgi:hypothetical protein
LNITDRPSSWPTTAELDDLVSRFRVVTLPKREWTHAAHLAVGTWHVSTFGEAGSLVRLRRGITTLNTSHGTPNTDTRGYHETITAAYVTLIARVVASFGTERPAAEVARAVLGGSLARRDALLAYYTPDALFSVAARHSWVEPDRAPFPAR